MKFNREDANRVKHFAESTIDRTVELCRHICPHNTGYEYYCEDCDVRSIFIAAKNAVVNMNEAIRWLDREEGGAE